MLVYELWQGDERLSMSLVPFVPTKHLNLTDPELRYTVPEMDEGFEIEVTARRLARFVWLVPEGADPSTAPRTGSIRPYHRLPVGLHEQAADAMVGRSNSDHDGRSTEWLMTCSPETAALIRLTNSKKMVIRQMVCHFMASSPQTDWGEYYHKMALMYGHLPDTQINRLSNYVQ